MPARWSRAAWAVVGRLVAVLVRGWFATLRVELIYNTENTIDPSDFPFNREIFALCERDALALVAITRNRDFTTLVAHGRDGDWAAAGLRAFGCHVVRGATRRGGVAALRALGRRLQESTGPAGLVVDGPVGPDGIAQPGAIVCARATGRPVRPLGAAASPSFTLPGTWSGLFIPLPFARVVIACDDPLPLSDAEAAVEVAVAALTARLALMRTRAAAALRAGHGSAASALTHSA
jgi:lysophospholipid acyltransferase (LPLAT)-like uncharacterized protein